MSRSLRMTLATQAVLKVLLDEPAKPRYGFDIARDAGLATGSLYPILARLEQIGWVSSSWEQQDDTSQGRPRRRYYTLTGQGELCASQALHSSLRRATPNAWRAAGGLA
jgi:PadR family transcriptional regulator, regulatory protein PadR